MRPFLSFAIVSAFVFAAVPAQAEFIFTGTFSGEQETDPAADESPGTGNGLVTLSDDFNTLEVTLDFSGLLGNTTDSHIHCCAPLGANAGVAVGFTPMGFPLGVTSGTFSATFDLTLAETFNPPFLEANGGDVVAARDALAAGLQAGLAYLNIHTTVFGPGEIRAQLTAADVGEVPEPATLGLLGLGLGVLAFGSRHRRA